MRVNITDTLIDYVLARIHELFEQRIQKIQQEHLRTEFYAESLYRYCIWKIFPGQYHLMLKLGSEFANFENRFNFRFENLYHNFWCSFEAPRPKPVHFDYEAKFKIGEDYPEYNRIKTAVEEIAQISQEREQTKNSFKTLLLEAKTLKRALETWPTLWDYLPEDTQERHNRKTERAPKTEVNQEAIDTAKAGLLKTKLLNLPRPE